MANGSVTCFAGPVPGRATLDAALRAALGTALGRAHRVDPVRPVSGGPAGNARLTAWTGLLLLVLFVAELVTLLDVRGLISWHLAIGVLLVPPALLKTATTGWRIARYYAGNAAYAAGGPPPLVLRVLGPLVVLTTVALLGTGVTLVLVGEATSRNALLTVVGQRIDLLTLHQASFVAWCVATGLHVLGRLVPAWMLTRGPRDAVPGAGRRGVALVLVGALGAAGIGWVLLHPGGWRDQRDFRAPSGNHAGPRPGG